MSKAQAVMQPSASARERLDGHVSAGPILTRGAPWLLLAVKLGALRAALVRMCTSRWDDTPTSQQSCYRRPLEFDAYTCSLRSDAVKYVSYARGRLAGMDCWTRSRMSGT